MAVFCSLLGGCASRAPLLETALPPQAAAPSVELARTPFFPQERYQCGPAALATVLEYSGVDVRPEELAPRVFIPAKQGSLQVELSAASRRYQRVPYTIGPRLEDLVREIRAGRPVLVLQNLGLRSWPVWHYAVVIGYSVGADEITLRSGTTEKLVMPARRFSQTWRQAGSWGMVVLRPGELPEAPDRDAYLKAVAAMEGIADPQALEASFRAAVSQWPESSVARFGLANALQAQGQSSKASATYRKLLAAQPEHIPALNNLALVLAQQGCFADALNTVDKALSLTPTQSPLRPSLLSTQEEIRGAAGHASRISNQCSEASVQTTPQ